MYRIYIDVHCISYMQIGMRIRTHTNTILIDTNTREDVAIHSVLIHRCMCACVCMCSSVIYNNESSCLYFNTNNSN